MNKEELLKLLRTVQKNVRCPQCGREYLFSEIIIRGVLDDVCFLELNCQQHLPLIATVFAKKDNNKGKSHNRPISSNDVIDIHRFLKNFDGNFSNTFIKINRND